VELLGIVQWLVVADDWLLVMDVLRGGRRRVEVDSVGAGISQVLVVEEWSVRVDEIVFRQVIIHEAFLKQSFILLSTMAFRGLLGHNLGFQVLEW